MKFILDEWYGKNINFWYALCQNINFFSTWHLQHHYLLSSQSTSRTRTFLIKTFHQSTKMKVEIQFVDGNLGARRLLSFDISKWRQKKKQSWGNADKKHRILIHVIQFLTLWQEWRLKKYHLAFRCILNISSVIQRITCSMELFILPHTIQIQFPWIE